MDTKFPNEDEPVGWVEPLAKPNFDFVGFPS
jgi:hypothetical protein